MKLISDKPNEYITLDSIVDGPGLRMVIWFQGCNHFCRDCHNPKTHSFSKGNWVDIENIKSEILKEFNKGCYDGITFSGGDPIYQIDALYELTEFAKNIGLNVWVYTGFIYEDILTFNKEISKKLKYIDVLVDGPFERELKTFDCIYRGSSNQRLIDIQESLAENRTILFKE